MRRICVADGFLAPQQRGLADLDADLDADLHADLDALLARFEAWCPPPARWQVPPAT